MGMIIDQIRSAVGFAYQIPRYREILAILYKYGFADVLKLVALQQLRGIEVAQLAKRENGVLAKPLPERLRLALEELGPTFIKFGQLLSSRRDLVSDEYYVELCKLQDEVPPFPIAEARRIISDQLGASVGKLFDDFDATPIGSASIAQVHRAVLKDGATVAVKVQRPGIEEVIALDLAILADLVHWLEKHVPEVGVLNPTGVVEEFSATLLKELDFTNESTNVERFAKQFADESDVRVPKIHHDLSAERVLTMEYLGGLPVDDPEVLEAVGISSKELAERITKLIYRQIFEFGFFHGDPHPGNMIVMEGGVVGLYDFGMMGSFTPDFRVSIARLIVGVGEKNNRQVMRSILEMSVEGFVKDPADLLQAVEEFSEQNLNQPLREIRLGQVLNKLLELLRTNNLRMRGSFYLGIKALVQVEAIGRALDPDLNFIVFGGPYAAKTMADSYQPGRLAKLALRLMTDGIDFLEELPHDVRLLYTQLKHGKFNIPLEHKIAPEGIEPLRKTLDSIANRLADAILTAAVLICSSILVLSNIPPIAFGVPVFGFVGLSIGAYMCARLVLSIWRHGGL
jgi:ubiquinone biosynthesis protein